MFDRTHLSRLITLALASCAVTWAFAAGAFARPDSPNREVAPPPVYKVVPGDTNKAPSVSTAPAYQPAIGDHLKAPDRAAVDRNLAGLAHGGKTPGVVVAAAAATDDNTDTIALITAIVAMLVALAAVTFIVIRPQRPVLRA
jgi:hypothetical protein